MIAFATQQLECTFYFKMYKAQRLPCPASRAHDVNHVIHAISRNGTFRRIEMLVEAEDHVGFALLKSMFVTKQSVLETAPWNCACRSKILC